MTRLRTHVHPHFAVGVSQRQSLLPPFVLPAAALTLLTVGWGPNMALAVGALLALLAGCTLLWRPGATPILLYVFCIQWLEASLSIFHANLIGVHINANAYTGASMEIATVLSLLGLLALAAGMRLAAGSPRAADASHALRQAEEIPQRNWLALYIAVFLIATSAQVLARYVPGLSQPLLALANFKWAAFVILTYVSFANRDASRVLWLGVFLIELILSFDGYFSSFKFVFIYAFIGIVASGNRYRLQHFLTLTALIGVALMLGVMWTAIKSDYRSFVSGVAAAQIVTVNRMEQLGKLVELTAKVDAAQLTLAADQLARRLSYVEYFGAVINYVPSVFPHQHGELWFDALSRPFMPRMFFPGKEIIDESALTRKFTGLQVAGMEQGTQISIGYMGETYIDFGKYGMMVAVFALGLFLGRIHKWLISGKSSRGLLGMGMASAILMSAGSIGNSSAKLFGAVAVSVLVAWLIKRFAVPHLFQWLRT